MIADIEARTKLPTQRHGATRTPQAHLVRPMGGAMDFVGGVASKELLLPSDEVPFVGHTAMLVVHRRSPDAVSEFRLVTNNQSAEYGRAAGATVNVAYRSGGNSLTGDVFEFFRDTSLNAFPYFLPPDGQKPPLRRNQYGGVFAQDSWRARSNNSG